MEVTILYCSSNREDEVFEQRIRDNITANCGNLQIVSVTQKPVDFGKNICVGPHKNCYFNQFRQMLAGVKEIETRYVLMAEADFLYPKEYFEIEGEDENCYRYDNVWVLYCKDGKKYYQFKGISEGAQLVRTDFLRDSLDAFFINKPDWDGEMSRIKGREPYKVHDFKKWSGPPAVTFKTGDGVRWTTTTVGRVFSEIPHWGKASVLAERMFG